MGNPSPPDRTPARHAMGDILILDQLEMLVTSDPVAELDHALADTAARLRAAQARGDTLAAQRLAAWIDRRLDELLDQTVPAAIRLDPDRPLGLPAGMTERAASARLRELAARNQVFTSLIGLGYHGTITPPVIQRNVLEDPAWYTAYTPYQPEIAQGRLEALLNFQTMVADLTGMELANASLL